MRTNCKHNKMKYPVNIHANICDCPDLCKHNICEYYDDTQDGTRKFIEAAGAEAAGLTKTSENNNG